MKTRNSPPPDSPDTIIRLTTVADAFAAGQAAGATLRESLGGGTFTLEQVAAHDPRARALTLEIEQAPRMVVDRHAASIEHHEAQTALARDAMRRATTRRETAEHAQAAARADLASHVASFSSDGPSAAAETDKHADAARSGASVTARRYPWLVEIPLVIELLVLFVVALGEFALNLSAFKALREQSLSTNVLAATVGFATAAGCYLVALGLRHVLDQPAGARGRNPVHLGLASLAGGVAVAVLSVAAIRSTHLAMLADLADDTGRRVNFWPPLGLQSFLAIVGVGVSLAHINPAMRERNRLEADVETLAEQYDEACTAEQLATCRLESSVAAQRKIFSDVVDDVDINIDEGRKVVLAYHSGLELALGRSLGILETPPPTEPVRMTDIRHWLSDHPVSRLDQVAPAVTADDSLSSESVSRAPRVSPNGSAPAPTNEHVR